jgi:Allene oxide cyclase barrel like domain
MELVRRHRQEGQRGPGDVYTSQQSLSTTDGHHVGVDNGFGVNLKKPYVFFHWTASLDGGTLTIGAVIDLMDKRATYPINGGTGRYAGTRGTVTITDAAKNRSLVVVRHER